MFSEQMATAMAESGGIGIADTILRQFGLNPSTISGQGAPNPKQSAEQTVQQITPIANLINRAPAPKPVSNISSNTDLEIVSMDAGPERPDESWRAAFTAPENGIDFTDPKNMAPVDSNSRFIMPVAGRISSRFGNRFHPIDKVQKFHGGIDIAAPRGTPIRAASDGEVVFAGRRGGYGNMVIIQHADGRTSRYAHAQSLNVFKGQKVSVGETIGAVGSTGKATGPHLHFEVRENGKPVNPFELLAKVQRSGGR
ncbi:MAG: peptidoglycan DD-metalloendopeptidase family protein [Pyrinomonadaceae bacterium]|nr:peptidoglycan DD-metalloendopeptidase family protein [Pyrinomonadaceae bacterium]